MLSCEDLHFFVISGQSSVCKQCNNYRYGCYASTTVHSKKPTVEPKQTCRHGHRDRWLWQRMKLEAEVALFWAPKSRHSPLQCYGIAEIAHFQTLNSTTIDCDCKILMGSCLRVTLLARSMTRHTPTREDRVRKAEGPCCM